MRKELNDLINTGLINEDRMINDIAKIIYDHKKAEKAIDKKLIEVTITERNTCVNKCISDADIGDDILIVMIKRKGDTILPKGSTIIQNGDILIVTGENIENFNEKSL